MTKSEAFRVQLARAVYRASLGTIRMLLVLDPLLGLQSFALCLLFTSLEFVSFFVFS